MVRIFLLIIFLMSSIFSYAGTIHPDSKDSDHLDYGSKFIHTIIVFGKKENAESFIGSGVIIRPNYVITAAHVVDNAKTCFIMIDKKAIIAQHIVIHEDFVMQKYGKNDIAIIKLATNVDINWFSKLYRKNDEVGKTVSISGFGSTGNFKNGNVEGADLKKRAGSNVIDRLQDHLLITSASDKGKTSLEFVIAVGDSGGPLYIDGKLAGINSCVMSTDGKSDSSYGDEAGHTRISLFAEWIDSVITE